MASVSSESSGHVRQGPEVLRRREGAGGVRPRRGAGRVPGAARRLGLRQDHGAAHPLRPRDGDRRPRADRRPRRHHILPKYRDISMVFQSYALYPHKTVAENIGFPLKVRKVPQAESEVADPRCRRPGADRAAARPLSAPALRRPAPARGARARHRPPAFGLPHGRAAVQPRCQAARPHARRAEAHAGRRSASRRSMSRMTRSRP